jgi:hypothetical protein
MENTYWATGGLHGPMENTFQACLWCN